jgi:hypothetical protein
MIGRTCASNRSQGTTTGMPGGIRDLGSVNESIADVLHGKAKARIVLQP